MFLSGPKWSVSTAVAAACSLTSGRSSVTLAGGPGGPGGPGNRKWRKSL